ncbi:MAG: leucine-rich repeat protein [Bacilli bacterium]|nr:leucine-rich repeat protein [Bacilli bacterium]
MDKILDKIFREIGRLPTDGTFGRKVVRAAKDKFQKQEFADDAFLHSLNFVCHRYGKALDTIVTAALKYDEKGTEDALMAMLDAANADGVPVEVYGVFLNRLLAYCGIHVDPTKYQSLADFDPKSRRVSETMGSYAPNPADFVIDSSKGCLSRYLGKAKAVLVPTGIRAIADGAFAKSSAQFVCLPNSVQIIGKGAFEGCTELIDLRLPAGLTEIPESLFKGDKSYSLFCSPGIKKIGKGAFAGTSVPFGPFFAEVEEIGEYAFAGDPNIGNLRLGPDVKKVGAYAFAECANLSALLVEGSPEIEDYAFSKTPKLSSVDFHGPNTRLAANVFAESRIVSLAFHGGVIGQFAFLGCGGLAKVHIEGDTIVGSSAFAGLPSLANLSFGDGKIRIEAKAFEGCGATSLSFKNVAIGNSAFAGCKKLSGIRFEGNAMIGQHAFEGDSNLKSLQFSGEIVIERNGFANCGFTSISLGKGKYGEASFGSNAALRDVIVSSDEAIFSPGVFSGCGAVQSLTVPSLNAKSGHPFLALFGRQPYENAATLELQKGQFYLHPLDRLTIGLINQGDVLPKGLAVGEVRVENAETLPANFLEHVSGLKRFVIGAGVKTIESGFCHDGFEFVVDPKNPYFAQEDGLLLTKDKKVVLAVLDPSKLSPNILKKYERIGATIFKGQSFPKFLFGENSPVFGTAVFEECSFDTIVIGDWSKLSKDTFLRCTVKNIELKDAKGNPCFLDFPYPIETLTTSRVDRGYLSMAFFDKVPAKKVIVADANVTGECDIAGEEVEMLRCNLTDADLRSIRVKSLACRECRLNNALLKNVVLSSLAIENCEGNGLDCSDAKIENISLISAKPVSFAYLHNGESPLHVKALRVEAPKLLAKDRESIEAGTIEVEVPALEDDAFHGVAGQTLSFLVPVKEVGEYAFAFSSFDTMNIPEGSCFSSKGKERFLVNAEGIAFHVVDADVHRMAFNDEIRGYTPSLFAALRDSVVAVLLATDVDVSSLDFQGFSNLTRVSIGAAQKSLNLLFPNSPIEEVLYEDEDVPDNFFEDLQGLKRVGTKKALRHLGFRAFAGCSRLQSIENLESVEEVGDWCFAGDVSLQEIRLPHVKKLGLQPFYGCSGLTDLSLREEAFHGKPLAAVFANMPYPGGEKVSVNNIEYFIPKNVANITLGGVGFCDGFLTGFSSADVTLTDPIVKVGAEAFAHCGGLHADLSRLEEVAERGFYGCWLDEKLVLPSIRVIKKEAFAECASLKSVQIGPHLTEMALDAFCGFEFHSIQDFVFEEGAYRIQDCCLCHHDELLRAFNVVEFPKNLVLDRGVKRLCAGAIQGIDALESLELTDVEVMESGAVANNANLVSIAFGPNIRQYDKILGSPNVEKVVLEGTPALEGVRKLSDLMEFVGHVASFTGKLASIPEGFLAEAPLVDVALTLTDATELPTDAFATPSLRNVSVSAPLLANLPKGLFDRCAYLEGLDLLGCPRLQVSAEDLANLAGLTTIKLSLLEEPIKKILAKRCLSYLKNIVIGDCPELKKEMFTGLTSIETIEIKKHGSLIHQACFENLPVKTIAFGSAIIGVESQAFRDCHSLTFNPAFFQTIIAIGEEAFAGVSNLGRSLSFRVLGDVKRRAFADTNLDSLEITEDTAVTFSEDAFAGTKLREVSVAGDLTLGDRCFANSFVGVSYLRLRGHLRSVGERVFQGCAGLTLEYTYKGDIDALRGDDSWKQFRDFGSKPGFFGKIFHSPYIKVKRI